MPRDALCPACGQDITWCEALEQSYIARIASDAVRKLLDPAVHTRQATTNYLVQNGWMRRTRTPHATAWILLTESGGTKVRVPLDADEPEWGVLMAELVYVIADALGVGELRVLAQIELAGQRVHA